MIIFGEELLIMSKALLDDLAHDENSFDCVFLKLSLLLLLILLLPRNF